jgi:uncharacterized phage-associated protein
MYKASTIAKYFIWKSKKANKKITNKKLQKLLYYAQVWSIVIKKERLFDDKIEAWIHGPAINKIYEEYKKFGYRDIDIQISDDDINEELKNNGLLDEVWKVYGKFDAEYLEKLTHSEAPWQNARENLDSSEPSSNEIKIDDIKQYYSKLIKK